MSSKSNRDTTDGSSKKSNYSNQSSLFSQKHTAPPSEDLPQLFKVKILEYYHQREGEVEHETISKNITKSTDELIRLDTIIQLIEKQPYEKWSIEAQKILSISEDPRSQALAEEIDNSIVHPSSSFSNKR